MSFPPLPEGWSRQVSRSTGKVYFFNSQNGASTYDPADIVRLPAFSPPPPLQSFVQQPVPAPQTFCAMSNMTKLSGQSNNQLELGIGHSVTELQMLLAEKKRQLEEKMQELGGEEASSEESGFGSLGGEAEEDFPSVIGSRVKRRVDRLWHQQTRERESIEKRIKEDVVQNDAHFEMSSTVANDAKESKQEETGVESSEKIVETVDGEESDEEDIYGADEEELELIAKLKEKYTEETNDDCLDDQNGHQVDSDHEDAEKDNESPEDVADVLLLSADISFGEHAEETETIPKERANKHNKVNNISNEEPFKEEVRNDQNSRPLSDDLMSTYYRLLAQQALMNNDLQSERPASISPDRNVGVFSPDVTESMQLPLTEAVIRPGDPKFSSDEESGEDNSSGQDE